MPRLLVHVEGETEEAFVNELLGGHLLPFGYETVGARLVGHARSRNRRGGIRRWESVQSEILRHLKENAENVASLLVDYYALPREWPGHTETQSMQGASRKAEHLEAALLASLVSNAGGRFDPRRFVPFILMHEFEGLLFSAPEKFAIAIGRPALSASFTSIRAEFETPEEINDSRHTAPSKRILKIYPEYEKPISGTLAAIEIGLVAIRRECPHFHDWMTRMEALPSKLNPS